MIKSFKDFDYELNGQKVYESVDDIRDKNSDTFTEDVDVELLSDNKYLLKISRIIFKKLSASNLGNFGIYPMVINIDNVPGIYFYNNDNPSINIVVCRNTHGKHVYLFRKFEMSTNNVADLVLSTETLGFTAVIDKMIDTLKNNTIEEGLIFESNGWREDGVAPTYKFNDIQVSDAASMDKPIRQGIVDIIDGLSTPKKAASYHKISTTIWDGYEDGDQMCVDICKEIMDKIGKGSQIKANGYYKNAINIFVSAYTGTYEHSEVENVLDGCVSKYGFGSGASGSGITSSTGVSAMIDDGLKEQRTKEYEQKIIEDANEYNIAMDNIFNVADVMCKYVKQNGVLSDDDWGVMRSRGMLITGKAGVGKTYSIDEALRKNGMRENKDYFNVSSGNTSSKSLYKKLYDYNGKLLIFDDSAELFNASYKISFWKFALEDNIKKAVVELSQAVGSDEKIGDNIYVPGDLTRQERYYVEVGSSTPKEKADFDKVNRPALVKKYIQKNSHILSPGDLTPSDNIIIDQMLKREWKKHEETKKPKMPNRFNFKGLVIVISNKERDEFKKEVGGQDNWDAITRRMRNFDLHPKTESMWNRIKEDILKQYNNSELTDKERIIPKLLTEEFIAEVEEIMKDSRYRNMNYSIVTKDMHKIFNSKTASANWKRELKELMKLNK
jgi:hypothetical protein